MSETDPILSALEQKLRCKEKIIAVLTKRVEREINAKGSDYDAFQAAAILEKEVRDKTHALNQTLSRLRKQRELSERNRLFLKKVLDNINDFIGILSCDGRIKFANAAPLEAAGLSFDTLEGCYFWETDWFDFPDAEQAYIRECIEKSRNGETTAKALQCKLGTELFWIQFRTTPLYDESGKIDQLLAEGLLIDDQKKAELALEAEKERIQTTLESIGDAVIATDRDCRIEYMNPVAEQLTGWRENRAIGQPLEKVFFIINETTGKAAANPAARCMKEGRIVGLGNHTGLIHRDGHVISIEDSAAPIRYENGEITGAVLVFHDVTQTRRLTKELEYHANHDSLTGLINRRQFESRLGHCLKSLKTKHADFTLLYMDLDQFKLINDTCGHQAGDELLRLLTTMLRAKMRERDTLARLGGDEFGILLEHCPPDKGLDIANEIRQLIEEFRFSWEEQIFNLGASIGLVNLMDIWDIKSVDPLKLADTACYAAKDAGRNRVHVYQLEDQDIQQREGEMVWVSRIGNALENDHFELYFQPIISIQKKAPPGMELLIRMTNYWEETSKTNTIPPGAFLPAAERYGLDGKIDRWVVLNALTFFAKRAELLASFSYCSINISGKSIASEDFLRFVQAQFIKMEVPYNKIAFEVTETSAILNLEHAKKFIKQMQGLGCTFLLDDFGSGMSSFTYLKQLPVNKLKIDGAFVRDVVDDEIDRAMVRSINDVGHAVGMETVAEFVENEAILKHIALMGIDHAQGYGIAKPAPLAEINGKEIQALSEKTWKTIEPDYTI